MAAGSNLSSVQLDYSSVNDVDYQVSPEDVPDLTRGPWFLGASAVIGAVLVLIMAVCGLGNCAFIVSLARSGRLRTLADRLVANLALSDALVALCCPLLLDYYTLKGLSWDYGLELCAAVNYVRTLSLYVSTNALLGIAVDRYLAIVFPLRPRPHRSGAVLLGVWLVPALLSVPVVLTTSQTQFPGEDGLPKTFCAQVWTVDHRALYQTYFLLVLVLQFLVPVAIMTVCYTQVCRELWFKTVPGFQTPQVRLRLLRRRRTVLMLVLVLGAYVVCWSPYYVFALLRDFHPTFVSTRRHSLLAFYVIESLAMSNGIINTLCFVCVRGRGRRRRTGPGAGIRLRTFIKTKSSNEENRTMSTRGTDTETGRTR